MDGLNVTSLCTDIEVWWNESDLNLKTENSSKLTQTKTTTSYKKWSKLSEWIIYESLV
jgi:hypothetical protein